MKILLINPYGPIPIPEENWREYRFTIIGNHLASLGHEVIWYTSSFSHHFKKQRSDHWKDIEINSLFKIRLVPTPGYKSNRSLNRLIRDWVFGFKVYNERKNRISKPDLIIYGENPLTFGYAGYRLAKYFKVPVICDQGDLWPEFIINSFPKKSQKLVKLLFFPVFFNRKMIYNRLDGLFSLAEPYLNIPLSIAPNLKNKPHVIIYNGIDVIKFRETKPDKINLFAETLPIKLNNHVWFVFAGTLGPSYDILNLLKVAALLYEESNQSIKIIIAGDGPLKKEVNEFIKKHDGDIVTYLGQLNPENLAELYQICDVGLSTYTQYSNVEMCDKFYDYTAAGLSIINSLTGEVSGVIEKNDIGINYLAGETSQLYQAIVSLSLDQIKSKEMASRSFELGMTYDKNIQIKKLGPFINEVMNSFNNLPNKNTE
tara:strand:+ start:11013 stop:12296 length:1284 start_codon:yes stop_codon:yes gene_type:complete